ncbi:MAG TPA: GNAT family N-acetyltransferase [Tepidisphaeraceae bacterium]
MQLRAMHPSETSQVAALIHLSTNGWYQRAGKGVIFQGGPETCLLFPEVYEDLDPGCCVVAVDESTGQIIGSCFYHPRETHVSLGIMNVHPDHFGRGIASALLKFITDFADQQSQPVRLVSSAMNLDSFSLYNRAGFVPRAIFQDILISVPEAGLPPSPDVRPATLGDVPAMVELEFQLCGIRRQKDFRYFIENRRGIWNASVLPNPQGGINGFLCSVHHPASNMLGPGVMRTDAGAIGLIRAQLNCHKGRTLVFLIPSDRPILTQAVYALGGRNCELHFAQVRGAYTPTTGIIMPTFMPETA